MGILPVVKSLSLAGARLHWTCGLAVILGATAGFGLVWLGVDSLIGLLIF